MLQSLSNRFFPADEWLKTLTANQNQLELKELGQLKRQHVIIMNRTLACVPGVDANTVTVIVYLYIYRTLCERLFI